MSGLFKFCPGLLALALCLAACTSAPTPSLKGLAALPTGLQYLVLPLTQQTLVYYGLNTHLYIFCQAPGMELGATYLSQQQLPLSLAWKNGLTDEQNCYAQRIKQAEGDATLAALVAQAPVLLRCPKSTRELYCAAAIKALDQSNLTAHDVGQMFCQRPYQCRWNGEQLIILL